MNHPYYIRVCACARAERTSKMCVFELTGEKPFEKTKCCVFNGSE